MIGTYSMGARSLSHTRIGGNSRNTHSVDAYAKLRKRGSEAYVASCGIHLQEGGFEVKTADRRNKFERLTMCAQETGAQKDRSATRLEQWSVKKRLARYADIRNNLRGLFEDILVLKKDVSSMRGEVELERTP